MIKHIVMWKLLEQAEGKSRAENAATIKSMLENLRTTIPQLLELEVGLNVINPESNYDVVLISSFKSKEDLKEYNDHPEHQKVAQFIGKVREFRCAVDYVA